jgi:putative salt-induced outer membrane protein YdiY
LVKDKFWFLEAFEQIQFDAIRQIDKRFLLGLGIRHKLVSTELTLLNLGASMMYENEKFKDEPQTINDPRFNFYGNVKIQFLKNASVGTIFYYQPQSTKFSTFRLSSITILTISLSKHFAFKAKFDLNYDNGLLPDVPKLVYEFKNALAYKF